MDTEFTLINGLADDKDVHKDVVMREITAGDILAANENTREIYQTPNGAVLMCPNDKVMVEVLCRIITKLGDLKMPLSKQEFNKLSLTDLNLLQDKYLEMREKADLDAAGGKEADLDAAGRNSQPL